MRPGEWERAHDDDDAIWVGSEAPEINHSIDSIDQSINRFTNQSVTQIKDAIDQSN